MVDDIKYECRRVSFQNPWNLINKGSMKVLTRELYINKVINMCVVETYWTLKIYHTTNIITELKTINWRLSKVRGTKGERKDGCRSVRPFFRTYKRKNCDHPSTLVCSGLDTSNPENASEWVEIILKCRLRKGTREFGKSLVEPSVGTRGVSPSNTLIIWKHIGEQHTHYNGQSGLGLEPPPSR